jgi:hypothetical protein
MTMRSAGASCKIVPVLWCFEIDFGTVNVIRRNKGRTFRRIAMSASLQRTRTGRFFRPVD